MKKNTRKITLALSCSLILMPLGCGGQNEEIELNLRIDNTPIEREDSAVVNSYSGILRDVQPAVVSVFSQREANDRGILDHPALREFFGEESMPREGRMQRGVGSGVIVSPEGYVLTNNHVVIDAERIIVRFANDGQVEAEVVGSDAPTDIAVLRLNGGDREYAYAVLADSDLIEVGDIVFALGNALGIGHAVTSGIISARGRTGIGILGEEGYEDFIQTDAPMNIGNSGGPLVDSRGRVIGINTAIASPGGGNVGIGFAIPINMARDVMRSLIEFGEVRRGFLGISLRNSHPGMPVEFGAPDRGMELRTDDYDGALVVDVVEESPAARAGLREGDIVVELNGQEIRTASDLRLGVARKQPGTDVELAILRDEERMKVLATLGDLDEASPRRSLPVEGDKLLPGVMVAPMTTELREELGLPEEIDGLAVVSVEEGSPYREVFPPGAVIVQVNRQSARNPEVAREAFRTGRNLVLMFYQGAVHHVLVEVNDG